MSEKINLNIQPQASVYALFSRLSYVEWYALAEFVDNSTASYYAHQKELENSHFDKLVVEINYDPAMDTITIEDNAFGMELAEFKRAILLDSKPIVKGRNEFGYGLKTAATWFGNRWSVESTQLDSENLYSATIDIDDLVSSKKNDTDINVSRTSNSEHYTKITISKLNRRLNTTKIKKNIITLLNSMYRRDLKAGKIEIIYNGTTLSFTDYPVLHFRDMDWKKDVNFSFDYEGKTYTVNGFVGIMEPGGVEKTGFALFRNNRAIENNYKPVEIFGSSKTVTQIELKLFGELDMDSFEVNQAKDGFSWNSDLQELFINNLKNSILDFIDVAKMSKKDREAEITLKELKTSFVTPTEQQKSTSNPNDPCEQSISSTEVKANNQDNNASVNSFLNEEQSNKVSYDKEYKTVINYNNISYSIYWTDKLENKFIYSFSNDKLLINLKHNFIKNILSECEKLVASKFILAYVLSEEKAKMSTNSSGYVAASVIHNKLDQILNDIK